MKSTLLSLAFGWVRRKTDGYKTIVGGVGLILSALLGLAGLIWPDQGLPQMSLEMVLITFSSGMAALGIGGKAEKIKAALTDQAGRGRLVLLMLISGLCLVVLLAGCAIRQPSHASTAAKSLLGTQAVVVGLAQAADDMCTAGTLKQDRCDQVAEIYAQARAAYDISAEMLIVAIQSGESEDNPAWANYQAVRERFGSIAVALQEIAVAYGISKGASQ